MATNMFGLGRNCEISPQWHYFNHHSKKWPLKRFHNYVQAFKYTLVQMCLHISRQSNDTDRKCWRCGVVATSFDILCVQWEQFSFPAANVFNKVELISTKILYVSTGMEDTLRWAYHLGILPKSPSWTQPCNPLWSLNWVPALAGVTAGMSPLPSGW